MSNALSRREEQDELIKTILMSIKKGHVHWSDLIKKTLASCHPWATPTRTTNMIYYLMRNNFIKRVSKGIYEITDKGNKFLEMSSGE